MANEIRVQSLLQINKTGLVYTTPSSAFQDDMEATPRDITPGHLIATTIGVDIDLSKVTNPGWTEFRNLDATNSVAFGIWNPDQSEFYPFALLGPGQHFIMPLHPLINQEFANTGTGTTGQLNTLRALAQYASCNISVKVFER